MARVFKVGTDFNCVMRRDDEHQLAYAWPEELPYFEPSSLTEFGATKGWSCSRVFCQWTAREATVRST